MAKIRKCGNCGKEMEFLGEEQIQLGQVGVVLGHLSNLLSGSLDVELWECYNCGKIDFYRQGSTVLVATEDKSGTTVRLYLAVGFERMPTQLCESVHKPHLKRLLLIA